MDKIILQLYSSYIDIAASINRYSLLHTFFLLQITLYVTDRWAM